MIPHKSNCMKRFVRGKFVLFILQLIIICLFSHAAKAQDKIIKTDSTIIEAKISEIGTKDIQYRKFNNLTGPVYIIARSDVHQIVFENGEQEVFNPLKRTTVNQTKPHSLPPDSKGNNDAVVTKSGDTIRCVIESVKHPLLTYIIRRTGTDRKVVIETKHVKSYFYKSRWHHGEGTYVEIDDARNSVLNGHFQEAIQQYAIMLASDTFNVILLSESAYALALAGVFDVALMRLDYARILKTKTEYVNYFTAQVYALMGYTDLYDAFWKDGNKYETPAWIKEHAPYLRHNNAFRKTNEENTNNNQSIDDFHKANALASINQNIQALALFRKVIEAYPGEYLPYVGYGIVLEKAGAVALSSKMTEKAIELIGSSVEENERKQLLENRLAVLKKKVNVMPPEILPGLWEEKNYNPMASQFMAYYGGMFGPSLFSMNARFGIFAHDQGYAALGTGYTKTSENNMFDMALSFFWRQQKIFVYGLGLQSAFAPNYKSLNFKISLGLSLRNKKHTNSFDFFLDYNQGLTENSINSFSMSIGQSFYFGKRKNK